MSKKITYQDKTALQNDETIPDESKVTAENMNEIKETVNKNADELDNLKQTEQEQNESVGERLTQVEGKIQTLDYTVAQQNSRILSGFTQMDKKILDLTDKAGNKLKLEIDTTNYIMTLELLNEQGETLDTKTIDFPLESFIVDGKYENGNIILTLQSGTEITIPIGSIINGLISQETFDETVASINEQINNIKNTIETIQSKCQELETENQRLREDIDEIVPTIEGEGENITLNGASESRFKKFEVSGNSWQETREGYNLVDFSKLKVGGTTTFTFVDDVLTVKSSESTHSSASYDITELYKNNAGKFLRFCYESWDNSQFGGGSSVQLNITFTDDSKTYPYLMNSSGTILNYQIPDDVSNIQQIRLAVYSNNTSEVKDSSITINKPMLILGEEDKPYEPYGASPSPEYPSEIRNCGDNGNVNFSVGNKNLLKFENAKGGSDAGVSVTVNKEGTYTVNGTATSQTCNVWLLGGYNLTDDRALFTLTKGTYCIVDCILFRGIESIGEKVGASIINVKKDLPITGIRAVQLEKGTNYNNKTYYPMIVKSNVDDNNFIVHQEQPISFPTKPGQVLHKGDYLANDGVHYKRGQYTLPDITEIREDVIFGSSHKYVQYVLPNVFIRDCNYDFLSDKIAKANEKFAPYVGYLNNKNLIVFADDTDTVGTFNEKVSGAIIEYSLEKEIIEPYSPEQQKVYDQIKQTLHSYKDVTYIFSEDEISPIFKVEAKADMQTQYAETQEQIDEIKEEVTSINATRGHVFGVRRKITDNSSSAWERLFDSVGKTANATKNGGSVQNDFDNLAPWSEIKSCNYDLETKKIKAWFGDPNFKFNGENGDVFTYYPKTYWKIYQENDYDYVLLADYPKAGFTEVDGFFIGRYNGSVVESDSKLHSYSGLVPTTSKTIVQFRTLAQELGDNFSLLDWRYFVIQMLYLVEYADYNSQSMLGNGIMSYKHLKTLVAESNVNRVIVDSSSGYYVGQIIRIGTSDGGTQVADARKITKIDPYNKESITGFAITFDGEPVDIAVDNFVCTMAQMTGQCDNLGMKSGCINNDRFHSMIYRGVENIFANIWQWVDGINMRDHIVYICKDHSKYASNKFDEDYKPLAYANATETEWVKTLGLDVDEPFFRFPTEIGGGSSTYMSDYYYQNTEDRVALVGGAFNAGTGDGLWCWSFNGTSSYATWYFGCRVLIDSQ